MEYTLQQFKKDVIQWSTDRLIIKNGTVEGQLDKLDEELKETMHALINSDQKEIKDGIGDCAVVLINLDALQVSNTDFDLFDFNLDSCTTGYIIDKLFKILRDAETTREDYRYCWRELQEVASHANVDFMECCLLAWNEIKDRKGYFCDKTETFIKEVK